MAAPTVAVFPLLGNVTTTIDGAWRTATADGEIKLYSPDFRQPTSGLVTVQMRSSASGNPATFIATQEGEAFQPVAILMKKGEQVRATYTKTIEGTPTAVTVEAVGFLS